MRSICRSSINVAIVYSLQQIQCKEVNVAFFFRAYAAVIKKNFVSNPIINATKKPYLLKRLYFCLHCLVCGMVIHLFFFPTITTSTTLRALVYSMPTSSTVLQMSRRQAFQRKASSDVRGMTDDVIIKF
jgi:alpha-D-ribose 1-methylphosphonate 5-triphosphate synthase subunit PhnI